MLCLECLLKLTVPNLSNSNRYVLAKLLIDFADAGQAALVESSDQGLQSLSNYLVIMLGLECLL